MYVDPETLEVDVDPAWSDATYYAVECQDYAFLPDAGTPRQRLDAWLDEGAAAGIDDLRLGSVFYGDLPCLFWPAQPGDVPRPAPIVDPPYPTLVLNADTDGPTPVVNAMRVFSRMEDSYLVLLEGGPHVIFDWGYACVDDLVSDAIVTGEPPSIRVTVCEGDVADPYVANPPADAEGYADPFDAAATVAAQLTASSEYAYWDGSRRARGRMRPRRIARVRAHRRRHGHRAHRLRAHRRRPGHRQRASSTTKPERSTSSSSCPDGELTLRRRRCDRRQSTGTYEGAPVDTSATMP